ncbi:MAG: 1-deoxy-D-xylulose-5-phosphate synthase N-terminal domain-containing protein, partial [candidate division WOR-3 bacterium]
MPGLPAGQAGRNGILDGLRGPEDLRRLSIVELRRLAAEIRELMISTVAQTGGHLAPSLGTVELTLALHYVFDTPGDKIVWDVGHQCYAHKIITGRLNEFQTLRQAEGISGFPKRAESVYDVFDSGHSGDSISVALGLALGRERLAAEATVSSEPGADTRRPKIIAVIGDGSIAAGVALEALNHAGGLRGDIIVILNDNEMSIARTTGGLADYLNRVITGRSYNRLRADVWNLLGRLPSNLSGTARLAARKVEEGLKNLVAPSGIFEELGLRYFGPFDGHNLITLIDMLRKVKAIKGPILVHVVTRKGKGYPP